MIDDGVKHCYAPQENDIKCGTLDISERKYIYRNGRNWGTSTTQVESSVYTEQYTKFYKFQ